MGSAKSAATTEPLKPGSRCKHLAHVECAGAKIEIPARWFSIESQLGNGLSPPPTVDVETEKVVQKIVSRSDLRESFSDVIALFRAAQGGAHCTCFVVLPSHPAKLHRAQSGEAS